MALDDALSSINQEVYDEVLTSELKASHFFEAILDLVEERRNGRCLDIGCNDGSLAERVASKAKLSKIYGIDIAKKALKISRSKGIKTIFHDLNEEKKLPFPDDYFDIVICSEVIEHILPADFLLDEIHRVLKNTGYAIISTPRLDSLYVVSLLLFGFQPEIISLSKEKNYGGFWKTKRFRHSGHISLFTKRAFKQMLLVHSFKIIKYASTNIFVRIIPFRKDTQIWKVSPIK